MPKGSDFIICVMGAFGDSNLEPFDRTPNIGASREQTCSDLTLCGLLTALPGIYRF